MASNPEKQQQPGPWERFSRFGRDLFIAIGIIGLTGGVVVPHSEAASKFLAYGVAGAVAIGGLHAITKNRRQNPPRPHHA